MQVNYMAQTTERREYILRIKFYLFNIHGNLIMIANRVSSQVETCGMCKCMVVNETAEKIIIFIYVSIEM